ncbi:hypothetical protein D3C86_887760 [compost metagenome]
MKTYPTLLAITLLTVLPGCDKLPGLANSSSNSPSITGDRPAAADEWEYLVVSSGKVYFSSPSKQVVDASGSIFAAPFSQEAVSTQSALDKLGKEGWELVTIVGQIGGDQEFILKRRKKKA